MQQAQPEVFSQFDLWNSHPYPMGAFRQPPWEQVFRFDVLNDATIHRAVLPPGWHNRGVNSYEWELWKLSTYGITGLPVMITETGWRYAANQPESLDAGDGYPIEEVAYAYLDLAMRGNTGVYNDAPEAGWTPWLRDERVVAVAVFALDGVPWEWAHTNLLVMNADGTIARTTLMFDILASYQRLKN